jgi:hypothetical protein
MSGFIFQIRREDTALLLHLLKVFVETTVLGSASGMHCGLVVGFAQALFLA